jgi:F-type H+-transporting ATPase subunit epsilon
MYERSFQLEIVTPSKVIFKDEAPSLSAPGVEGNFQILYNHAPFMSALDVGELKIKVKSGNDARFATGGGFVEVKDNRVIVLADSAERVTDIDVDRAQAAKARAEERLRQQSDQIDEVRARAALARALNRLHLSQKA